MSPPLFEDLLGRRVVYSSSKTLLSQLGLLAVELESVVDDPLFFPLAIIDDRATWKRKNLPRGCGGEP